MDERITKIVGEQIEHFFHMNGFNDLTALHFTFSYAFTLMKKINLPEERIDKMFETAKNMLKQTREQEAKESNKN